MLAKLEAHSVWIDTSAPSSERDHHPSYNAIRAILPNENDARLAFQAQQSGAVFITVDRKTILTKRDALAAQDVIVASPSEFLSTLGSL